jgi:hypothetical protein
MRGRLRKARFRRDYYFIEDRAGDVPYYFYTKERANRKIYLRRRRFFAPADKGNLGSQRGGARSAKGYQIHRVCFPPELKTEMARLYHRK